MEWKTRKGKVENLDRSFDIDFWQNQSAHARLSAAWQMVIDYHLGVLGEDEDKLRLQRSVVDLKQEQN